MTARSLLPGEAVLFWTVVRDARTANADGTLTADMALDTRETLIMIARYSESLPMRKRCGRAIMDLRRMREALAA
jgi:hypothetical protein